MDFLDQARNVQTLKEKKMDYLLIFINANFACNFARYLLRTSPKASSVLVETRLIFHFLFLQVKHENNDNTFRIIKLTKIVDILFLACVDDAALT